ncbi:adenosylmethionine--8-amino-7-oxononanoate transaminase, partial [bacterium]|nr:adenosylmethionine--8-amino-7-oxononanoate transaminase [bacterium]
MKTQSPPFKVMSASGTRLILDNGRQLIDAISSWWCMIHGYSHPDIVSAISDQAAQMSHVMLGGLTHDPAERLASQLEAITPGDLSHVFFGDSGSVGVEIALKMAIQYASNQGYVDRSKIAYLTGAYHGDTLGAMSVCDPEEGMHRLFGRVVIPQLQLPRPPKLGTGGDDAYLNQVESILSHNRDAVCAVIIEPLMQGAGGFYLYSPTIVQGVRRICDTLGILLICDEVATGFGRLGSMFASERCHVVPDIMVLGKALTGGHIGMSATIARPHVFGQFWSDFPDRALMHGPTFMGNPLACRAALASIQLLKEGDVLNRIAQIEQRLGWLYDLRNRTNVVDVRVMGAMGVV